MRANASSLASYFIPVPFFFSRKQESKHATDQVWGEVEGGNLKDGMLVRRKERGCMRVVREQ